MQADKRGLKNAGDPREPAAWFDVVPLAHARGSEIQL